MDDDKRYALIANVKSDRILRTGAKVWILMCNGDAEFPKVYGVSKSGRMVEKYIPYKRLYNFRAAWCPDHIANRVLSTYMSTKDIVNENAEFLNKMWAGVRFFNRDGSEMIQDGIPAGQAFKRDE